MPNTFFGRLCAKLKLYDEQQIPGWKLTREITGSLSVSALVAGKADCWRKRSVQKIPVKKTMVLSGWLFEHITEKQRNALIIFMMELLEAGFGVCISAKNGMIHARDHKTLLKALDDFTPIPNDEASKLAAGRGIKRDFQMVLDSTRLSALLRDLDTKGESPDRITTSLVDAYPEGLIQLPEDLTPEALQRIEDCLLPGEKLSISTNVKSLIYVSETTGLRKRLINLDISSSDPGAALTEAFPNLEYLTLTTGQLDFETLKSWLMASHTLKTINLNSSPFYSFPADLASLPWPGPGKPPEGWQNQVSGFSLERVVGSSGTPVLKVTPNLWRDDSFLRVDEHNLPDADASFRLLESLQPDGHLDMSLPPSAAYEDQNVIMASIEEKIRETGYNPFMKVQSASDTAWHRMSEQSTRMLFLYAPNLEFLIAENGLRLPGTLCDLLPEGKQGKLRYLVSKNLSGRNTADVQFLLDSQPALEHLDLRHEQVYMFDLVLEPGQCQNLRYLDISDACGVDARTILMLLEAAPNIETLILPVFGDIRKESLSAPCLKELSIEFDMHIEPSEYLHPFNPIFQNSCLVKLTFRALPSSESYLIEPALKFEALRSLYLVRSIFSVNQFVQLLQAAPGLRDLEISDCQFTHSEEDFRLTQNLDLTALRTLRLYDFSGSIPSWFNTFAERAKYLETLVLEGKNKQYSTHFRVPGSEGRLEKLQRLSMINLCMEPSDLARLLRKTPNLVELSIEGSRLSGHKVCDLQPASLPELRVLTMCACTEEQCISLLQAAPNLKRVELPQNWFSEQTLLSFKTEYPAIQWSFFYNSTTNHDSEFEDDSGVASEASEYPNADIRPDGDFSTKYSYQVNEIFLTKSESIKHSPEFYHLGAYQYDPKTGGFVAYQPRTEGNILLSRNCEGSPETVKSLFDDSSDEEVCLGELVYHTLVPGICYMLPATSTKDLVMAFGSTIPDGTLELWPDPDTGYHFFRVNKPIITPTTVRFMARPGTSRELAPLACADEAMRDCIGSLEFGENGTLIDNPSFRRMQALTEPERLAALAAFCNFETAYAEDMEGFPESYEIFNYLLKHRAGACRHRAQLFVALADSFGSRGFYIDNGCHAFATMQMTNGEHLTFQLGGASAEFTVNRIDRDGLSSPLEHNPEQVMPRAAGTPVDKPLPDNPFQTWNTVLLQGKDAPSVISEVLARPPQKGPLLLLTEDNDNIEALHAALVETSGSDTRCFFSNNLDDIALDSWRISESRLLSPSRTQLGQFIDHAERHPEQSFTWFVNWSNAESRHTGLNSMIDLDEPKLESTRLPPNLKVVAVMDKGSEQEMGKEFLSRLPDRSLVPPLQKPEPLPVVSREMEEQDILIPAPHMWEKILLGEDCPAEGGYRFEPGALLTQRERIFIQNAPWELAEFRAFARDLLKHRRFFCNGEWHHLPKSTEIHFITPHFNLPLTPYTLPPEPPKKISLVLNNETWESFFTTRAICTDGIHQKPGLLETFQGCQISLQVTSTLTEAQWFVLSERAEAMGVYLQVVPAKDVALPQSLLRVCTPAKPVVLTPRHPVRAIVADDTDYALNMLNADCEIAVDGDTTFESLFVEASVHPDRTLVGGDSDLLKAFQEGRHIVLYGRFSDDLTEKLQSLCTDDPLLTVNGKVIPIKPPVSISLLTDAVDGLGPVELEQVQFPVEESLSTLEEGARNRLVTAYRRLRIKPCFSHFTDCPQDKSRHMDWVEALEMKLFLSSGAPWKSPAEPEATASSSSPSSLRPITSPETLMNALYGEKPCPFVFLVSESGEGKTHLMLEELPVWRDVDGKGVKVYQKMDDLEHWLNHKDGKAILFVDEANISTEAYQIFESLARGKPEVWYKGKCYALSENQRVVFAGNPIHYGGRTEADLFRRYPYYRLFSGRPLPVILEPLLRQFEHPAKAMEIIGVWYDAAKAEDISITPRNALMICQQTLALKNMFPHFPEQVLLQQAIYQGIKTLHVDTGVTKSVRGSIKKARAVDVLWMTNKDELKAALSAMLPEKSRNGFVWTNSRKKIAMMIVGLLELHKLKHDKESHAAQGICGLLLEGMPGIGKSRLIMSILLECHIEPVLIPANNPTEARRLLLYAFRHGRVAVMDEFNSFPDEALLNDLLSGIDHEDPSQKPKPGFCLLATQNPASMQKKELLSKALSNRMLNLTLKEYKVSELQHILVSSLGCKSEQATKRLEQWQQAKNYARQEKLCEPDTRTLFKRVREERQDVEEPDATLQTNTGASSSSA